MEQERDEALAAHQQALTESTQTLAEQGMRQLHQELATAKQVLEHLCSQGGASTRWMSLNCSLNCRRRKPH